MRIQPPRRPLLLVISAPSGAGKTTLCRRLLEEFEWIRYSVSCTTRPPRGREQSGRDYVFLGEEEFQRMAQRGEFLEYARVLGYWYGTPRDPVVKALKSGYDVLMDIDVQGASTIRSMVQSLPAGDPLREGFVDIFIAPPSLEELRRRLLHRREDSSDTIEFRLRQAEKELEHWREYRYLLVNDDIERAYDVFRSIVLAEHHRINPCR
ncbi:MAG: guanylate kinase [Verrucomicrobia bacterium]|nr:MAG: guanylate kinase [Verrucomicrobiota bacterium]